MSWVTIIWAMVASACLTLAAMHLLVWFKKRAAWANLLFALSAAATAAMACCELWMMRAETTGDFGLALRWLHVPAWVIIVSLVGFIRLHLRAGRPWLAWAVCGVRTLSLIFNFVFAPNLNYREITALRHIRFLGEEVAVAAGVPNPWMLVGQASFLLLLLFVVEAAITVWRRDDRYPAKLLGGAIVFFFIVSTGQAVLALWGITPMPLTSSLWYMGVVAAMGFEFSDGVIRVAQLADDLRESEQRATLAMEAAGIGVWIWNVVSNQIWGSERWLRLFGFAPDEAVTFEKVIQRIHPDDRDMVMNEVRRALADQGDYVGEYRVVLPDDALRWIVARGRMIPDAPGRPARMVGTAIDITARKQAELESLQSRAEIAHLSRVAMLGELSGSLAHELNQPLTAILSNAQAAQRFLAGYGIDLDEMRDILRDIVADDQRAGEIIRRLRLLLKKGEVHHLPLDLNEVVQDVLKLIRNDLLNHNITLHAEFTSGLPAIEGDRVQLQQVLLNLIVNAADAMADAPKADRKLSVRTERFGEDGVGVSVVDRGTGLAPELQGKIFEPYFTTKSSGMGLGLKVCRTIVESHGGHLAWENNADRGATFRFSLPARKEEPA